MAQVVGDNYKRKKPAPKPKSKPKNPLNTGGFLQAEMNQFESERFAQQGAPVGGASGSLSVNLARIAAEIAADQKKSKAKQKEKKSARKAATNSLHWLLDQLSRSGNAVSTGLLYESRLNDNGKQDTGFINPLPGLGAFAKGAREGWNLNERSNFKEVLNEGGYTGRGAGTLGFIGDVTLDPLNLIPGGYIAKGVGKGNQVRKGLQTRQGARELGQAHRAGVASRIEHTGPDYTLPITPNRANPFQLTTDPIRVGGQTHHEVLAEGDAVVQKLKKGRSPKAPKKSKAEIAAEKISAQMDETAAPVAASVISRITGKLPAKTDVRIEPLREADEAARLRPIVVPVSASSKAGHVNPPDAVPLDQMPRDVLDTIEYDARKRADEWFDRTTQESAVRDPRTGKIKTDKSGKQLMARDKSLGSIKDLRRQVAMEGRNPNLIKLGSGKTGADVDVSPAATLKAIESSDEYIAALKRARVAAIKAHNKNLPKAKKEGPVIERVLAAIPPADEIVEQTAKAVDTPVGAVDDAIPSGQVRIEFDNGTVRDVSHDAARDYGIDPVKNPTGKGEYGDRKIAWRTAEADAIAKSEIARRGAVAGGGNTSNLEKALTPIAPAAVGEKIAAVGQGTYRLTPELEKAVDAKIDNIVNQIIDPPNKSYHNYFSSVKQVNLYNSIRDALVSKMGYKKGKDRASLLADPEFRQFVREQYIRAENVMTVQHGFPPLSWHRGVGKEGARALALSDFFQHVSVQDEIAQSANNYWTKIMTGEDGSGLSERILAGSAIAEAPKVAHAVQEAVDTAVQAVDDLPEAAAMDVLDETPKAVKDALQEASPSAQEVAKDNVKAAVDGIAKAKGELWALKYEQRTIRQADTSGSARLGLREAEATDRIIGLGNIGNHSLIKINASAIRRAGGRMSPGLDNALANASSKARAAGERLTVRFNAAHGFDPFFHSTRRGVANSAAARSQQHMGEISRLFHGMSHDDVKNVLNDVQMGKLDNPKAQEANEFLTKIFDPEDGWLVQSGITMGEFQEQLHRLYPTRTNAQGKAVTDWRPQVVEKPVDKLKKAKPDATWHDSWRYWNWTDNPAVDLLKIRLAFENSLAQRHMYEDLAHNFGISKASKEVAAQAKKEGWVEPKRLHPALQDQLFPPEIAAQINKHEDMFRMRKDSTSEFMKKYDKLLQGWKTGVTIYSPSHHIRNMAGDMWMAFFVDGVKNPIHYRQALRAVLHEKPELDPAAFGEVLSKSADKDVLFKMGNGTPVTAEQFRIMWRDMGGHQAFASADNLNDLATVKGRIPTIVREKVASPIEDVTRMGHAIALMKRSKHKDPVAALEEIIPRVNRAHVDYGNLTDFERQTMRRLIPFYTWQRHVFPVLLDSMMRNPQRIMVYPKAQVAISEARGYERDDTNFFPQSHQIAPEWMTEGAGVPYSENKRGNVIYGDPSNPFNDAIFKGLLLHPKESIGGMMSPFLRVPVEMFVRNDPVLAPEGRQFFGGIPIKNRAQYIEDNTPILNNFIRITRRDPLLGFEQREPTIDRPDEQGTNMTTLINFLTAGGLQENTERRREFAEKMEQRK